MEDCELNTKKSIANADETSSKGEFSIAIAKKDGEEIVNESEMMSCKKSGGSYQGSDKNMRRNVVQPPQIASTTLLYCTFFLLGISSLVVWNFTCQALPYISKEFFDNANINNNVLGTFQSVAFITQACLILLKRRISWLISIFAIVSGLFGLLVIPAVLLAEKTTAIVLFYIFAGVMGGAQGIIQGMGYGVAAQLPKSYVGAVSFGQGVAGALIFLLSTVSAFAFFNINTQNGVMQFIILGYVICALVVITFAVLFPIVMNLDSVRESFAEAQRIVDELQDTSQPRPVRAILKDCWPELCLSFLHFFITYHLYPNIGPLHWNYIDPVNNYLVILYGTFFAVETVGRALPDLASRGKGFSWLMLPRTAYIIFVCARILFLIPFLLAYFYIDVPFVNSFWWLFSVFALLALTQGWAGTLAFHYACNAVDDPKEKLVTGPAATLAVVAGVCAGLFSASGY